MKTLYRTNEITGEVESKTFYGYKPHPQSEEIWIDFLSGKNNSQKELAVKYNTTLNKISNIISKKFLEKKI